MTNAKKIILIFLSMVVFLLIILCAFLLVELSDVKRQENIEKSKIIISELTTNIAILDKIYIYGTHFNFSGEFTYTEDIKNVSVVLFDSKERKNFDVEYEYTSENNIKFRTSNYINEGIYLDDLKTGNYYILLKIEGKENTTYYKIYNKTSYKYMDYYTITRNNKNNYIEIVNEVDNLKISIIEKKLPNNVYDIILDPGHGGIDTGAVRNDIYESYINLEVALKLKQKLENIGLKVAITRTGDYNPGNISGNSPYGKNGRIALGYETKSKLFLSIHSNSLPSYTKINGVEIYTSEYNNKKLAKLFADNIVSKVGINYSVKNIDKVLDGVYVRNFTKAEINSFRKEAISDNYTLYESLNTHTQYYYTIRETGGIVTNAYVDGRNLKNAKNDYYQSNIGLDGYLIEMGYLTSNIDLDLLLNKKEQYALSLEEAIKKYLNITN